MQKETMIKKLMELQEKKDNLRAEIMKLGHQQEYLLAEYNKQRNISKK